MTRMITCGGGWYRCFSPSATTPKSGRVTSGRATLEVGSGWRCSTGRSLLLAGWCSTRSLYSKQQVCMLGRSINVAGTCAVKRTASLFITLCLHLLLYVCTPPLGLNLKVSRGCRARAPEPTLATDLGAPPLVNYTMTLFGVPATFDPAATSVAANTATEMYPWYRESVGQFCGNPAAATMPAAIKTETGYNDCMLALDYAAQSKKFCFLS
ncbi:hypothetical protein B566_EDAN016667 [Ephemera danica]|nr:hypothetical protein B566_EDAN016667 [Ephemera danica]